MTPCLASTPSRPPVATGPALGGRVVLAPPPGAPTGTEVPLPGVSVELLPLLDPYRAGLQALDGDPVDPLDAAITDAEGFYRVEAPSAGLWLLRLSAPGRATREEVVLAYLDDEEHDDLALAEAREVAVRVVDPEGRPVSGARVVAWPDPDEPRRYRSGRTDDVGRVTLTAAVDEPLELTAWAPGLAPAEPVTAEGPTAELRLRRGVTRVVEVVDPQGPGSRPAAGALVSVGEPGIPVGRTDGEGELEIPAPADAAFTVRARSADLHFARAEIAPPEPPTETDDEGESEAEAKSETEGEPPPVRLRLEAPATVSGRVLDADDRTPLAGVLLWVPEAGQALTVTDRAGGYRLELPELPRQPVRLTALLAGYEPHRLRIRPEQVGGDLPTLALRPASAVAGRVVDRQGEPVTGVRIRIAGWPTRTVGRARTGKDGRFLTGPISPGGPVRLLAEKAGYAPALQTIALLEPGRAVQGIEMVLERGRTIQGLVLRQDETPVHGAEVSLRPHLEDSSSATRFLSYRLLEPPASAVTDTRGKLSVAHVAAGIYDLRVAASGFAPAEVPGLEIPEGEEPFDVGTVVLETSLPVQGRVVGPEGEPLEGARIQAFSRSSGYPLELGGGSRGRGMEAHTGPDGRFSLGDFRRGEHVGLRASRAGFSPRVLQGLEIPSEPVEIVLQPGVRISGRVVDPRHRPIEGAQVVAGPSSGGLRAGARIHATTDAEGRFSLTDAPSGEITLRARAQGYLDLGLLHLEPAPGTVVEDVEIILQPGAIVTGQVRGPDGEPLPGAHVTLLQAGSRYRTGSAGRTDGDGRFRIENAPLGLQVFVASHERFPQATREVEVQEGENRLDFRLEAGRTVSGHVWTQVGRPIAGATLWLHSISLGAGRSTRSTTDGSFSFEGVADGRYALRGSHPEHGEAAETGSVTVAGSDLSGLELRLGGQGRIRGRIVGLALDELADVEVQAYGGPGSSRRGRPDFEGRFQLDRLPAGSWVVVATTPGGARARESVELTEAVPEAEVVLEFEEGLTLGGRVLVGSEPLTEGYVRATRLDGSPGLDTSSGHAALGPEGRFRIEGLSAGTYRLQVTDGRGLQHQEEVELGSDREILVELTAGRLTGRVLDAGSREPVSGVAIQLVSTDGDGPRLPTGAAATVSDLTGSFRLTSVTPGRYRLLLTRDGYSQADRPVTLEAGELATVEIEMEPSEGLTLQVRWAGGASPSPWVGIVARRPGADPGESLRAPVGEGGAVRIRRLAAGTWDLHVSSSGSGLATLRVTVPGPAVPVILLPEARLDLSIPELLEGGSLAQVEILDAAGRALPLYNGQSRQPVLGGHTLVAGLPAGPLTVRVSTGDGRTWSAPTTVAAGQLEHLTLE